MPISDKRLQYLTATHGSAVLEGLYEDRTIKQKPATPGDAIAMLAKCDPTADSKDKPGRYLPWLCNVYRHGWLAVKESRQDHALLAEDFDRIRGYLDDFDKLKHKLPPERRDIGTFTFDALKQAVLSLRDQPQEIRVSPGIQAQSAILYNGPEGTVVVPHTTAASQAWGSGTEWCTAYTKSADYFNDYNAKGALIILQTQSGKKYQIHGLSILRDAQDEGIETIPADLRALLDALPDTLKECLSHHSFTDLFDGAYPPPPIPPRRRRQPPESSIMYEGDDETARQYVRARVHDYPSVIANVSQNLQKDKTFLLELVAITPEVLQYVPYGVHGDRAFMLDAMQIDGRCIHCTDHDIRKNGQFMTEAVGRNIRVWESLDKSERDLIGCGALLKGFDNTLPRHWSAMSYVDDLGIQLSPQQELDVFERAIVDPKIPLTVRRLHLFPGLREGNAFMTLSVDDAHALLKSRCAPAPAVQPAAKAPVLAL